MRKYAIILVLLLALTLCACIDTPPPATTAPPLPTETTQPTESAPVLFCPDSDVIEDFSEYYVLLEHSSDERSWLLSAMGCVFSRPEEIALNYLFYNGFGNGSWDLVSPESEQYLIDQGFWREMDIQPMPREKLEAILQATFGISLSDVTIPDEWVYLEREDLYCSNHNDAYGIGPFTITAVRDTGSTIEIAYTTDAYYYNTARDVFLDSAELVLTLNRLEDGTIQAVSNLPCTACSHSPDTLETTVSDATAQWQDMVSSQAFSDWAFLTACSPTSEDGLNQLREAYPAFSDLAASPADGIPVVETLLNSDRIEDHALGIALARLLYTLDPSTEQALRSLETAYDQISTQQLITDVASSPYLEFFTIGSSPYPLSEEGVQYFSVLCPQMAVLMERENWLEELSVSVPAHIEALHQAGKGTYAVSLDSLTQYLLSEG